MVSSGCMLTHMLISYLIKGRSRWSEQSHHDSHVVVDTYTCSLNEFSQLFFWYTVFLGAMITDDLWILSTT